jgi:hypothetical protein
LSVLVLPPEAALLAIWNLIFPLHVIDTVISISIGLIVPSPLFTAAQLVVEVVEGITARAEVKVPVSP